jgi:hypothetical protein
MLPGGSWWQPPGTGGASPSSSLSLLPRVPIAPGGGLGGSPGGGGVGGGVGGFGGGSPNAGVLGGVLAALTAALVLLLLLLMRRAAAKPIWRSYLPEVPPA